MKCNICNKEIEVTVVKNYHYTMSGLDNVYLSDISVYECVCRKSMVDIFKAEELHTVIIKKLLQKTNLLTGKEIRFIRKQMNMKAAELAEQLGVKEDILLRWENGAESIDTACDKLLRIECMLDFVRRSKVISKEPTRKFAEFIAEITTKHSVGIKEERISISEKEICQVEERCLLTT